MAPSSSRERIGLVGCVKTKRGARTPARDLYVSPLFRGRRRYVEATCGRWFVLSARHGLVRPDEVLTPYDETLTDRSTARRRAWATSVLESLDETVPDHRALTYEVHAGAAYRDYGLVEGLCRRDAAVEVPTMGLSQGEQLAFYARGPGGSQPGPRDICRGARPPVVETAPSPRHAPEPAPAVGSLPVQSGGAYAPLGAHLAAAPGITVDLSFRAIERIIGRALPASARTHRAWWSNERSGTHSHARAWMTTGWLIDNVDVNAGIVRFRRTLRHA